ncbi:glycosyltransferase family 2 protein [Kitasatospora purpeofusca]|uniref:glycosyltransferase family 2 protein n=1 Tax=Kitasatospora purpeofusca TaxID=67352 RepID=UPI002253D67F|nr:glycosyltransferase [Kitasatospora purpeofusca]MCX4756628.1 glycosyltransferase family 2 protein [Kitasatospora purpeofusca]WSR35575.1 glycosyltransferase family 2 protein [Kitasatospora purpeofusca]
MSTTAPPSARPDSHDGQDSPDGPGNHDGQDSHDGRDSHPLRRATDRDTGPDPAHPRPMRRAGDVVVTRRSVSLVVPARNEARNIPWVFEQIPHCVDEVILVDGSSSDATVPMARHCLPTVRSVAQRGPGKGNALRTGFAAATGEYIVMIDADGSMWPGEIPHFLHFLDHGYDFVKGSRCIGGGGSLDLTRVRSLGNRALLTVANRLYDARLTDLCYGYCAFRRSFLDALDLRSTGFEIEAEMIAHALRSGLRIAEVPSLELPRRSGRSHLHAVADGRRVLRTLITERPGARSSATAPAEEQR